jgi:hypothetical protein
MIVQTKVRRSGLFLLALGWRAFGCLTLRDFRVHAFGLPHNLALVGSLSIQHPRVAICACMGEVLSGHLRPIVRVITFDVLPRVALFAVYRVPVIVSEVANTLDRIWLFFCRRQSLRGHIVG